MGGGSKSFFTGVALCILFSLLSIFAVLYNGFPLGVAGEWSWPRVKNPEIPVMEIVSIAMLFAIAAATAFIIDFRSAAHRGGRITGIVIILLCGLCIDYQILLSGRAGVNENIVGIIDKYTSGYMTEAGKISSPVQYFTDFINPQNSRSTTPEHIDVHPPGDILASWLALKACGKSETLRKLIDMALPAGCIQEVAPDNGGTIMASAAALLVLLMLAGITLGKGLILLAGVTLIKKKSTMTGLTALSMLAIPGPILFTGHFDPPFFFLSSLCCLFFVLAAANAKPPLLWAGLCGFCLGIGTLFTLAYGTLIILIMAFFLIKAWCSGKPGKNLIITVTIAGGGLAVAILCYLAGFRIIEIFLQCLHNQARFHADTGRSAVWAVFNFLDFLLFIGAPGFFLPFFLATGKAAAFKGKGFKAIMSDNFMLITVLYAAILLFMCLSPLTRGEMGRMLIFYMPLPLILACAMIFEQPLAKRTAIMVCVAAGLLLIQETVMRIVLKLVITM